MTPYSGDPTHKLCPGAEYLPRRFSLPCLLMIASTLQFKSNDLFESFTDSLSLYFPNMLWIYTFIRAFITLIFYFKYT